MWELEHLLLNCVLACWLLAFAYAIHVLAKPVVSSSSTWLNLLYKHSGLHTVVYLLHPASASRQ